MGLPVCERNGCDREATHVVRFHRHPARWRKRADGTTRITNPGTRACLVHAQWWCRGKWGAPIGTYWRLGSHEWTVP